MALHQIVYISMTNREYSDHDLFNMLVNFRRNNSQQDITGILLYKKFRFMQLLEGEKETINQLFTKIIQDHRHQDVLEIYNAPSALRYFPDWSMSFYNLGKMPVFEIPGYSDYLDTDLDNGIFKNSDESFKFLRIFKHSTLSA